MDSHPLRTGIPYRLFVHLRSRTEWNGPPSFQSFIIHTFKLMYSPTTIFSFDEGELEYIRNVTSYPTPPPPTPTPHHTPYHTPYPSHTVPILIPSNKSIANNIENIYCDYRTVISFPIRIHIYIYTYVCANVYEILKEKN